MIEFPDSKRYLSYASYFKKLCGTRLQKLVIDAGFTCPNRDGTVGVGGCTFCDNAAFHPGYSTPEKSITEQLEEGIEFHRRRYPRACRYLAYFQAYSNTYAPIDRLKQLYEEALAHPLVEGIVIGTRPDCVSDNLLDWLASIEKKVIVEYGIESCYDSTLKHINRGHDFACASSAVERTARRGLNTGGHFIIGLPGETPQMILDSVNRINSLPLHSVKFHQLQIVRGTAMEKEYAADPTSFLRLGLDDYLDLIVDILERLRPDLYIERVAGEVPPRFVNESPWGLIRNVEILRLLDRRLEERSTWQGRLYNL